MACLVLMGLALAVPEGSTREAFAAAPAAEKKSSKDDFERKEREKIKRQEVATVTGGENKDAPIYLHMPTVIFPIIDKSGAQQTVALSIDLHVPDKKKAAYLQSRLPQVKDAIIKVLYGHLGDGRLRDAYTLNLDEVKMASLESLQKVFGEDYITDVLIQSIEQRKL